MTAKRKNKPRKQATRTRQEREVQREREAVVTRRSRRIHEHVDTMVRFSASAHAALEGERTIEAYRVAAEHMRIASNAANLAYAEANRA